MQQTGFAALQSRRQSVCCPPQSHLKIRFPILPGQDSNLGDGKREEGTGSIPSFKESGNSICISGKCVSESRSTSFGSRIYSLICTSKSVENDRSNAIICQSISFTILHVRFPVLPIKPMFYALFKDFYIFYLLPWKLYDILISAIDFILFFL